MTAIEAALFIVGSLLLGFCVPWAFMRMLAPTLADMHESSVVNYRGHRISPGLGIAWLVWAGCAIVAGITASALIPGSQIAVLTLAGPLALVAFAMGLVDDSYGSADAKGFRGHLWAMSHGRMTTGGLKLLGIGFASLFVALILGRISPWGVPVVDGAMGSGSALYLAVSLLAGAAIALTSNLVNLTDLRPGRALKTYSVLAVVGAASTTFLFGATSVVVGGLTSAEQAIDFAALVIFLLGPVCAVWGFDLGEKGMLGDAGANAMGVVAGLMIVIGLPLWGLLVYAATVFGMNLVSERVSFSKVIEASRLLRWLDELGRLPVDQVKDSDSLVATSGQTETGPHGDGSPE